MKKVCNTNSCGARCAGAACPKQARQGGGTHARISRSSSTLRDDWPGGRLIQIVLTLLSGVPKTDQKAWGTSSITVLAFCVGALFLGGSLSWLAVAEGGAWWLALVPGWVLTVYGLRNLALSIFHEAAHGTVFPGQPWWNELIGQCASVVLVAQNLTAYRPEHVGDHHSTAHMTRHDPTVSFLFDILGLRPGMTKNALWSRLLWQLVSPLFHARLMNGRVRGYFRGALWMHQVAGVVYLGTLLWLVVTYPLTTVLVWLIPLTVLVNVSLSMRACTEHVFTGALAKGREKIALSTHAQRFGCPAPAGGGNWLQQAAAWVWWGVKMLGHAVCRMVFTPGESPQHDWHHRRIHDTRWPSAIFARQQAVKEWEAAQARGDRTWPPYTEVWGIINNIDECFRTLSQRRPEDFRFRGGSDGR